MADIGKPLRIIETEPLQVPEEEPHREDPREPVEEPIAPDKEREKEPV